RGEREIEAGHGSSVDHNPVSLLRTTLSELSGRRSMLHAMTPRSQKTAAALSGALVLASGAYALGTQTSDGTALAGGKTTSQTGAPGPGHPGGPGLRDLSDIASKLGVTEAKLRAALEDL